MVDELIELLTPNLLLRNNLPHDFFRRPEDVPELSEEDCLDGLFYALTKPFEYPPFDTSDFGELLPARPPCLSSTTLHPPRLRTPYVDTKDPCIVFLCFLRAYASKMYRPAKHGPLFKPYLWRVYQRLVEDIRAY
jgi:hypothetical protein